MKSIYKIKVMCKRRASKILEQAPAATENSDKDRYSCPSHFFSSLLIFILERLLWKKQWRGVEKRANIIKAIVEWQILTCLSFENRVVDLKEIITYLSISPQKSFFKDWEESKSNCDKPAFPSSIPFLFISIFRTLFSNFSINSNHMNKKNHQIFSPPTPIDMLLIFC